MGRDGIAGAVCLAASLGLLAATRGLPEASLLVPVGPGFYPRIVLGITAILAAALIVFDFIAARRPYHAEPAVAAQPTNYRLVVLTFVIFGVYVGALPALGFRISTLFFLAALQATLDPPRSARAWAVVAIMALVTTAVTYILFERYLLVLLPRGRWTDF
jgi:putative tricarboxylic transport membrane protein